MPWPRFCLVGFSLQWLGVVLVMASVDIVAENSFVLVVMHYGSGVGLAVVHLLSSGWVACRGSRCFMVS